MLQVINILRGKCPHCHKGAIFKSSGNIFRLKIPEMNERCPQCGFKFEKEVGFFFGAMFVSYGLAAAEMIILLVLLWYLLGLSPLNVFFTIVITALLASTLNFRLSRVIWIYMFYNQK